MKNKDQYINLCILAAFYKICHQRLNVTLPYLFPTHIYLRSSKEKLVKENNDR